ncbi:MAG: cupin domain-containing protein [Dehalococcoidia bacterium]|nr:cupin domain-containing protein [Dehalococcoidia bacterium]
MKLVRASEHDPRPVDLPIFTGAVAMARLTEGVSEQTQVALVRFAAGARTMRHTHTFEQILLVSEGEGLVTAGDQRFLVHPGDVVVIPPGEAHVHGGTEASGMAHYSITPPGSTEVLE